MYMGSYGSKLTSACCGGGLGIGGTVGIVVVVGKVWQKHWDFAVVELQK